MNNLTKPAECKSKDEIRAQIDKIDLEIISLFAKRFEYVKEIVKFKENNSDAIIDLNRKNKVIDQRGGWAAELGLDKKTYEQIFSIVVEHSILKEFEIIKKEK
jgi:chorismate mutase